MLIDFAVLIIGVLIGLFGFSNIILPLFYVLPKVLLMIKVGEIRKSILIKCFTPPILWAIVIIVLSLIAGYFHCKEIFFVGFGAGAISAIYGLFRKVTRKSMQEEFLMFIEKYKIIK